MTARPFVCVHGHFYQPPRENPWLEAIEPQDSAAPYHDWKRGLVVTALRHRHIETSVALPIDAHGVGRRRVTLHVLFTKGGVLAGFMEGRSHRLINKKNLACARALSGLANRTAFDLRRTVRDTDQYARAGTKVSRIVRLPDEVLQHLLSDREIRNNAVFQWSNRCNVTRRATQHILGLRADRLNRTSTPARILANCYNRRFIEHDASPT